MKKLFALQSEDGNLMRNQNLFIICYLNLKVWPFQLLLVFDLNNQNFFISKIQIFVFNGNLSNFLIWRNSIWAENLGTKENCSNQGQD